MEESWKELAKRPVRSRTESARRRLPNPNQVVDLIMVHKPVEEHPVECCAPVDPRMRSPPVLFAVRLGIWRPQDRDAFLLKLFELRGEHIDLRDPTLIEVRAR